MSTVSAFDDMPTPAAQVLLRPCCASSGWITSVVAGRPFGTLPVLLAASDEVLDALPWEGITEAFADHPRIGEKHTGGGVSASWSSSEQAGMASAGADVAARLGAGNVAYEEKFGYVFLICASGLSSEKMLAALEVRMNNSPDVEQVVVRAELRKIVQLRLRKVFAS